MKVLVTGSAGRVGSRLLEELAQIGHDVVSLDVRRPEGVELEFEHINSSVSNPSLRDLIPTDISAVAHLSAFMSWNPADSAAVFDANVTGTHVLLEAVKGLPLERFILASTGEVYPENKAEYLPVDEEHPRRPVSPYGLSKYLAEEMLAFYMRTRNIPGVTIRLSHTQNASELLDPNSFFSGARFFLKKKIERAKEFGQADVVELLAGYDDGEDKLVISRGRDGRPFRMHISETRDIVQGFMKALESDKAIGEAFNIGSDEAVRFDEAIPYMSELTGVPYVDVQLPTPTVDYTTSNEKAKRLLGFSPKWTFRDMLLEAAKHSPLIRDR